MDELDRLIRDIRQLIRPLENESSPPKSGTNVFTVNNLSDNYKLECSNLGELTTEDNAKCKNCSEQLILTENALKYKNDFYHPFHFSCFICEKELVDTLFEERNNNLYCNECHNKQFSPVCEFCHEVKGIRVLGHSFHQDHFFCGFCGTNLSPSDPFFYLNKRAYCMKDYATLFAEICVKCNQPLLKDYFMALGKHWHKDCFRCTLCDKQIDVLEGYLEFDGKPYCENHEQETV